MNNDLRTNLAAMRGTALNAQRKERQEQRAAGEIKANQELQDRDEMLTQLRPAERGEYDAWLRGYLQSGGTPTHFYDYPTPLMMVATTNLTVRALHGASSFSGIIIPENLCDDGGMTGHTNLYLMRGYLHRGFHDRKAGRRFAPVYTDTEI